MTVKVMKIDEKTGKISLSHKETMEKPEGWEERPARREGGNNGGNRNGGNRQGGQRPRPNGDFKKPEAPKAEVKAEPVPVEKKEEAPAKTEDKGGFFSKLLGK